MKYSASVLFLAAFLAQALGQTLVLLGGNLRDDNEAVWKKIVALAGGPGVATFGVISASAKTTPEVNKVIFNLNTTYAAKSAVSIPITKSAAGNAVVLKQLSNLTGIFIVEDTDVAPPKTVATVDSVTSFIFQSGFFNPAQSVPSDVVAVDAVPFKRQNLVDILRPNGIDTPVLKAIKAIASKTNGTVVGNAAVMGNKSMILDGDAVSALVVGSKNFFSYPRTPVTLSKRGGLGLLNTSHVIESRLSEAGREVRLMRALLESNNTKGLGVDENTAFVVSNPLTTPIGNVVTAEGEATGVMTMEVAGNANMSIYTATYQDIKFSFFSFNDTIDLTTGTVTFPDWKVDSSAPKVESAPEVASKPEVASAPEVASKPVEVGSTVKAKKETNDKWISKQYGEREPDPLSLETPGAWRTLATDFIQQSAIDDITFTTKASLMPLRPAIEFYVNRFEAVGYAGSTIETGLYPVVSYANMTATITVKPIKISNYPFVL